VPSFQFEFLGFDYVDRQTDNPPENTGTHTSSAKK